MVSATLGDLFRDMPWCNCKKLECAYSECSCEHLIIFWNMAIKLGSQMAAH